MKVAIVAPYPVFPPASGVAVVAYNFAKYLAGEKTLIQLSDEAVDGPIEKRLLLCSIRPLSHHPWIKALFMPRVFWSFWRRVRRLNPDLIVLEGGSWALYYYVLYFLYNRFSRLRARVIYHAHVVEFIQRRQKNSRAVALLTEWAEGRLLKECDLAFAVSEHDAALMEEKFGIRPLLLPNGVDVQKFDAVTREEVNQVRLQYGLQDRLALFMGMTTTKPNKEAIRFLLDEVFPVVVRKYSEVKLALIGGAVDFKANWLINPGNIPARDVPAFIKACDISVVPIFSGSGTRLKILESWAAGVPVVSTTKGAEGLAAVDGKNLLIADRADDFIEKIVLLLKKPQLGKKIAIEGKRLAQQRYSWPMILDKTNGVLKRMMT
ncbi:MAG: glycosyltransferase family 4 protein [Candidatus Aminicenantales bacterium]